MDSDQQIGGKNMFEEKYISSLFLHDNDNKEEYIKRKIKRRGVEYLSINELNYLRKRNKLEEISIDRLKNILYENMISYSDIKSGTGISRSMMCMILRGNRNCTIKQLTKIYNYLDKLHIKY